MNVLKKMYAAALINIKMVIVYKSAIWANVFVNLLQIIILYYLWMVIYTEQSNLQGLNKEQMITYIVFSRIIFINGIVSWGVNQWITDKIVSGQISMELLKPIDFQLLTYSQRMGVLLCSMIIYGVPVILICSLFVKVSLPLSWIHGFLFIISFLLAMSLNFLIEFMIGMLGFITTNGWGLQGLKEAIFAFLSGALIPVSLFPKAIGSIINYLPFKDIVYTPIIIYLGIYDKTQLMKLMQGQLVWVIVLLILSRILYKTSIRKVIVQGG